MIYFKGMYVRGFTLIEILIAMAIMLGLLGVGMSSFRPLGQTIDLQTVSRQVVTALDRARERTLASEGASQFGVHFDNSQYVIFQGDTYNVSDPNNEVHELGSQLEFEAISFNGGGSEVVFERIEGVTANAGTVNIRLVQNPSQYNTIRVLSSGQVDFVGDVNPTDTRVTDTRHVHFDLGWSIQGANTLTLEFDDPVGGNVTENIAMSGYFDAGQTEFDWEGTVDVNGNEQTMRVHTHLLDSTDTLLSITRDGMLNDKAVTISIDGQEIVEYAADGSTAMVGSFGGTMEVQ